MLLKIVKSVSVLINLRRNCIILNTEIQAGDRSRDHNVQK